MYYLEKPHNTRMHEGKNDREGIDSVCTFYAKDYRQLGVEEGTVTVSLKCVVSKLFSTSFHNYYL